LKEHNGLFAKFRAKLAGQREEETEQIMQPDEKNQKLLEEFESVKKNPGQLTGWDFDRAFEFIERYPDSPQAEILIGQMYATHGSTLKGLTYSSAVKVLERMPGHPGSQAIIKGMYKLEEDFIRELRSDVIAYMLKIIPDHPLGEQLTKALAVKNLTVAYDFVTHNPENVYTRQVIKAMFDRDPNVTLLLFQERLDHPKVTAIFEGIYNLVEESEIRKLTPNAILFILDVAPDHPKAEMLIDVLVESNYVKAFDYVKKSPEHTLAAHLRKVIIDQKPELARLLE
jgi:hypothetical protein